MLAAGVADGPLTELFRRRKTLQRKQLLRMLARENGFPSWEVFRPALARMPVDALGGLDLAEEGTAVLHLWFASEVSAVAFASENGGRAVRVGTQAVVLPH